MGFANLSGNISCILNSGCINLYIVYLQTGKAEVGWSIVEVIVSNFVEVIVSNLGSLRCSDNSNRSKII